MTQRIVFQMTIAFLCAGVVALMVGCDRETVDDLPMASADRLPDDVRAAAATVVQSYRFAIANAEVLRNVPCYCGCGSMGHTSNAACYLTDPANPSVSSIETHALGCSICVDITLDAMRLMRRGVGLAAIQSFVDSTYARYGPSNLP